MEKGESTTDYRASNNKEWNFNGESHVESGKWQPLLQQHQRSFFSTSHKPNNSNGRIQRPERSNSRPERSTTPLYYPVSSQACIHGSESIDDWIYNKSMESEISYTQREWILVASIRKGIDTETLAIGVNWIKGLPEQVDFVENKFQYFDVRLVVVAKSEAMAA